MDIEKIIVVGASAGGVEALKNLVSQFPVDLPAAVFITLHLFQRTEAVLPQILNSMGTLRAKQPTETEPIQPGQIYVAPPDYHLLVAPGYVSLGHEPKENLQRPCINVMFRSAAASYGPKVIGVLLTGMLDDGASGLWEIKQNGGVTIVQDPDEAAYRSMPESAIRGFDVDYIVRLKDLGPLLQSLVSENDGVRGHPRSAARLSDGLDCRQSCPECGGVMVRAQQGRMYEYACHVGHRFGLKTMVAEKTETFDRTLSAALAQVEELTELLESAEQHGDPAVRKAIAEEIENRREQARQLRGILEKRVARTLGA